MFNFKNSINFFKIFFQPSNWFFPIEFLQPCSDCFLFLWSCVYNVSCVPCNVWIYDMCDMNKWLFLCTLCTMQCAYFRHVYSTKYMKYMGSCMCFFIICSYSSCHVCCGMCVILKCVYLVSTCNTWDLWAKNEGWIIYV